MRKFLFLIVFALAAFCVVAKPVSPDDAKRVADHFWQSVLHGKGSLQAVDWQYDEVYLFVGSEGGFVMLSADDCARPVIAYSLTNSIAPEALPLQLQTRMDAYSTHIAAAVQQRVAASAADASAWQHLALGVTSKSGDEGDSVAPLIQTHWHQDKGYALFTPQHTPVGCAATAQGQMMRYWNYPAFGFGNQTYNCPPYGAQSADFAHTLYDWEHMPDQVLLTSPQEEQVAVSTLLYHVGVSLHMSYGPEGSAAAGLVGQPGYPSIDNSLKDYFYYSRKMRCIFKTNGYTDARWADSLKAELQLRHPIVYCGVAPEGGHGFICDGYQWQDDQVYFHFNFGWAGRGDGYYTVDNICPPVSPTGYEGGVYVFNLSNQALLGAVPDYRMIVSDSVLNFGREGGSQPLLFSKNPQGGEWTVSCSEPWVSVDRAGVDNVGQLTVQVGANTTGNERTATVTFSQDGQTLSMLVVQTHYTAADYCPLTVAMESTERQGWEGGAYLSFESLTGYVYATASLTQGQKDTVTVQVAPHDVVAVFHHGGGTDRYINYSILNQFGEHLVDVEYAYRNGGRHFIEWPCVHVGIDETEHREWKVWPNPVDDVLNVEAEGLRQVVLVDMTGRTVLETTSPRLEMQNVPSGMYVVRIVTDGGTVNTKIVKQ